MSDSEPKEITKRARIGDPRTIKIIATVATLAGIALFFYILFSVGVSQIFGGISKIGISGFITVLFLYSVRILIRAISWKLTVYEPYRISLRDTFSAVIIGEALSSMIPLGILISGTAKAFAVRKKLPLVVGLSSIATENLFYSLVTGLFISLGAVGFLQGFEIPEMWRLILDFTVLSIICLIAFGIMLVVKQWHWASYICEKIYEHGYFPRLLKNGRKQVRIFENQIFGFYRQHPGRFFPIVLLQVVFQAIGVFEVWFVLTKLGVVAEKLEAAFYLESVNRLITIVFKAVPFVIGVDEAGAEMVMKTLGLSVTVGVTVAIVRKGRTLFFAALGVLMIVRRGFKLGQLKEFAENVRRSES